MGSVHRLVKTKNIGITFGGKLKIQLGLATYPADFFKARGLHTYSDSSWGRSAMPFAGFVIMYLNGPLAWQARKLKIVPDSTCEAEMKIGSKAAKRTVGTRIVFKAVRRGVFGATHQLIDNKAMWDVITKPGQTEATSHFDRPTMVIKYYYTKYIVEPRLIPTNYMIADIFTKALDKTKLAYFRDKMMNTVNASTAVTDESGKRVVFRGKAARLWTRLFDMAQS